MYRVYAENHLNIYIYKGLNIYIFFNFQLLDIEALPLGPKEAKRRKKIQGEC